MTKTQHREPTVPPPRATEKRKGDDRATRAHLDALLDDALADTFPASDPVALLAPAA